MFSIKQSTIQKMHNLRDEGSSIANIVQFLVDDLKMENPRLVVIRYFQLAFNMDIKDAMQVGSWKHFEGGSWSDDMLEEILAPMIRSVT